MELLTQIWLSVGTPLTIIFWVYIILTVLCGIFAFGVFFTVLRMFWKDRKKFGGF